MLVKEILKITRGRLVSGNPDIDIAPPKISTDSRTMMKGGFFIALKGPNFDGDDFVKEAFAKGARGALVAVCKMQLDDKRIIIQVRDTLEALQTIASHHRMKFRIPVIGITGSNGKTTTKEMMWRVLSAKYNVLKNEGTKNNHIGLPLTLLKLESSHDICILEMGMNHRGEIRLLCDIAKPTIAVITNIGPSHLEFMGNLNKIFKAKREILESLCKKSIAILNGDDEYLSKIRNASFDILRFGLEDSNDLQATDISVGRNKIKFGVNGKMGYELNLLGLHNIWNALAAIAVGTRFNISYGSMKRSLFAYKPAYMRLNLRRFNGLAIIDDTYNSNPSSMDCALEALRNYPANARWVVSGDMLELGVHGKDFHRMVGRMVARSNAKGLLTFGRLSKATLSEARNCGMDKDNLWHCSTHGQIAGILRRVAKSGDAVLI
ncbi:MAG: UDP-N-acetylmuramoyl-tripeptide--D-alanyl-D-alanine ligase, partial [Candidatus Omnitrophica bacterium]|nr:UDP-N-acetylmuramoyl-tripeptide--D-alanyl-D-alanine ligase [Candidatus Omnitrophota bacterium]